jgi:hypothetical protein
MFQMNQKLLRRNGELESVKVRFHEPRVLVVMMGLKAPPIVGEFVACFAGNDTGFLNRFSCAESLLRATMMKLAS